MNSIRPGARAITVGGRPKARWNCSEIFEESGLLTEEMVKAIPAATGKGKVRGFQTQPDPMPQNPILFRPCLCSGESGRWFPAIPQLQSQTLSRPSTIKSLGVRPCPLPAQAPFPTYRYLPDTDVSTPRVDLGGESFIPLERKDDKNRWPDEQIDTEHVLNRRINRDHHRFSLARSPTMNTQGACEWQCTRQSAHLPPNVERADFPHSRLHWPHALPAALAK